MTQRPNKSNHEPLRMDKLGKLRLLTLAEHLWNLNEHHKETEFDMNTFCTFKTRNVNTTLRNMNKYKCDTVVCAAGYAALISDKLGLDVPIQDNRTKAIHWSAWCDILTGHQLNVYDWLFGGDWASVDNDPKSTARRFIYTVRYGIPNNKNVIMQQMERLPYANIRVNFKKEREKLNA